VIDWGARVEGYVSDLTRAFAIGEIDDELQWIHSVVKDANAAGIEAVRPEVPCAQIDHAARSVITAAGFGEYFIHRTGHGLGLEAHEGPYIFEGNQRALLPGMTFTVEPGIYLPKKGGVRIEDNVVTTQDGGESLSTFSRELQIIA
jgi:Xaa-Pro dipeptidase